MLSRGSITTAAVALPLKERMYEGGLRCYEYIPQYTKDVALGVQMRRRARARARGGEWEGKSRARVDAAAVRMIVRVGEGEGEGGDMSERSCSTINITHLLHSE